MRNSLSYPRPREEPFTVLVVDDQPTMVHLMYGLLKDDYRVVMATSGQEAVDMCAREQPDLVVLDVEMPGLDGFQTRQLIKQQELMRYVPIIFVTGYGTSELETRALNEGGVDFVNKPVNPSVVRARIRTHLTLKAQADQLRELVFVDGLTGICNRRGFDQHLEREWRAAQREQVQLGLVLLDVDHFKAYNDHYGHPAGDEALRAVAQVLHHSLRRPRDVFARYGGEEFGCIFFGADETATLRAAEYLRAQIEEAGLPHAVSPVAPVVTVSLGAASLMPTPERDSSELLRAADENLYRAKQLGRNRVASGQGESDGATGG